MLIHLGGFCKFLPASLLAEAVSKIVSNLMILYIHVDSPDLPLHRESLCVNGILEYVDLFASEDSQQDISLKSNPILLPLTWGEVTYKLIQIQSNYLPEIILGSDCFYDPSQFEDAISTIYFLLRSYSEKVPTKAAKFYCTYQTRSVEWSITDLLFTWGLKCVHIPLKSFGADNPSIAMSNLPGKHLIQMMEISLF